MGDPRHWSLTKSFNDWVLSGRPATKEALRMLERTVNLLSDDNTSLRRMLKACERKNAEIAKGG